MIGWIVPTMFILASVQGDAGSGSQTDVASGEWASGDESFGSIQPASHTTFQFDDQYPHLSHMRGYRLLKSQESFTYGGGDGMTTGYDWTAPMPTALYNLIAPPAWSHMPGDLAYINTFQELVAFQGEDALRLLFDYCYNKSKIVSDPAYPNAEVGWIELSIGHTSNTVTSRNLRCTLRPAGTAVTMTNPNPTYPVAHYLSYFKDPAYVWAPAPPPAPPRGYAQVYAVPTSCTSNEKDFGDGACHPVNNPCLQTCSNSYFSGDGTFPYPPGVECDPSKQCMVFCRDPGSCNYQHWTNGDLSVCFGSGCDNTLKTDGTALGFVAGNYMCDCRVDAPTATKRFIFMWWGISDFSNVYVDYTFTGSNSIRYVQAMNNRAHTTPANKWKRLDLTITHSLGTSTFSTSERTWDQIGSWEYEWGLREDLGTTYHDVTNIRVNPIPLLDSSDNKAWLGIERIAFFVDVLNPMPPAPPLSDCCAACASMAQAEDWDDYVCLEPASPPPPPMPPRPPPLPPPPAPPLDTVSYYEHTYNYTYELSPQSCRWSGQFPWYGGSWGSDMPGHYVTQPKAVFAGLQACLDTFESLNPAHITQNLGFYLSVGHTMDGVGTGDKQGGTVICCPGHFKQEFVQGVTYGEKQKLFRVTFHPKHPPPALPQVPAAPAVTQRNCADGLPWPSWSKIREPTKEWAKTKCTAASSAPMPNVHGWTMAELDAGTNPCNVVYDACRNDCSPDGLLGAASQCTSNYCDSYASGGEFESRCTGIGQFLAYKECAKTCGLCDASKTTDSHGLSNIRSERMAQYAACGGFPYFVTRLDGDEHTVYFPSFQHSTYAVSFRTYEIFSETYFRRITCNMLFPGCTCSSCTNFDRQEHVSPDCVGLTVTRQDLLDAGYNADDNLDIKRMIKYAWERNYRYFYWDTDANGKAGVLCYGHNDPHARPLSQMYFPPLSSDRNIQAQGSRDDIEYFEITPVTAPPPPPPLPAANSYFTSVNVKEQCGVADAYWRTTDDKWNLNAEQCFTGTGPQNQIAYSDLNTKVLAKLGSAEAVLAECPHYELCVVIDPVTHPGGYLNAVTPVAVGDSVQQVFFGTSPEYFRKDISGSFDNSNVLSQWAYNQAHCAIVPRVPNNDGYQVKYVIVYIDEARTWYASTLRCVPSPSPPPPPLPPPLPPPPITDITITSCSASSEFKDAGDEFYCENSYHTAARFFLWCPRAFGDTYVRTPGTGEDALYSTAYIQWNFQTPQTMNAFQIMQRGQVYVAPPHNQYWESLKLTITTQNGDVHLAHVGRHPTLCTSGIPNCFSHEEWTTIHYLRDDLQSISDVVSVRASSVGTKDGRDTDMPVGLKIKFSYREIAPFAPPPP